MVKWSAPAKRDLREIHRYIALDSNYYARKVVETIVDKAELLSRSPRIGQVVPEIEDPHIRRPGASSHANLGIKNSLVFRQNMQARSAQEARA